MKAFIKILIVFLMLTFLMGCVATKMQDGSTKWSLLPSNETFNQLEDTGKGALELLTIFAPFFGPAGGIAVGGLATGLTILKKVRPKLKTMKDKHQLSHTVASISVDAIEQIKRSHPKLWDKIAVKVQKECEESGLETNLIKNAIRELRGLPSKL